MKDFPRAEAQFEKILEIDPYRIDDIDVYSNILYVNENRLKLSRLAHDFIALDKDRPEICCLVGASGADHIVSQALENFGCRKPLLAASGARESRAVF